MTPSRRVAWQLLGRIRQKDAYARDVLRSSDDLAALDARERALATRLVLGVVASRGLLDAVLDKRLTHPGRLEPKVRDALRLSCYELLFLSTPSHAAVSEGVNLARMASGRAAGLANAVLRRVSAEDVATRAAALGRVRGGGASTEDLALVSGYPTWLLRAVAEARGGEAARVMALAACEAPPVYVAANEAKADAQEVAKLLDEAGFQPVAEPVPGALRLLSPAGIAQSPLLSSCAAVVADLSAQRVAELAVPADGGSLLEVGQGRGTKSILMQGVAARRGVGLRIVGVDDEPYKVRVAEKRMEVAGLSGAVSCVAFDACALGGIPSPEEAAEAPSLRKDLVGPFDAVFVDAPCSGTGTLRRHPEICWKLTENDVRSLAALQLRMLRAASMRVRVGGMVSYATCSILLDEDEAVAEAFLRSSEGRGFEPFGEPFLSLPAPDAPDGHFCARFVRRA